MYHSECEPRASFAPGKVNTETAMRSALGILLAVQAVIAIVIAAGFYLYGYDLALAEAALYGGGIGIVTSALLGFRVARAARPGAGLGGLYIGAVERFVFVAAAFAVGIAVLALSPIAILAGFAGAQCAYFIAGKSINRNDQGSRHGG